LCDKRIEKYFKKVINCSPMITSTQNPLIKNLLLLQEKPRARREQNLLIIEGVREVSLAVAAGFELTTLFYTPSILNETDQKILTAINVAGRIEISGEVFARIAYREGSGGVIALARPRRLTLSDLKFGPDPLILVLETVEKPGNLGALLRTADAANLDAVIVCDPQTDIYNPNAVRSSVGCIFTMPVVTATSQETIDWCREKKIRTFGTALTATKFYHETDLKQPAAIIMGSEAYGLSRTWLDQADELIKIPMMGKIDSMNVSASAAIVVFEAKRQRDFR
jgi:TrmH family RNA methyltransferase